MKKTGIIFFATLMITIFIISCSKGTERPGNDPGGQAAVNCNEINARFAADILPLVQNNCATGAGCHGNGSTNGPGALTNFNQISSAAAGIKAAVVSGRMPLGGSLSTTQINLVRCWVDNGTQNN